MANNIIKLKRKATAGTPNPNVLQDGEMVFIMPDGNIYIRQNATTLVLVGGLAKANLDSPNFTGVVNVPTVDITASDTRAASTSFVKSLFASIDLSAYATINALNTAIGNLVNSSPELLNTLSEIANALGNDENYAATTTALIGTKLDQNSIIDGGII
jgi:hypothetical protein